MPRRAAAYMRVSSQAQAGEDRHGYQRQIEDIRAYAEREDFTILEEYRDAITGRSVTRLALEQLKSDARKYDAILVAGVDRLARDLSAGYAVLAALFDLGLEVHTADQGKVDLEDEGSLIQHNLSTLFSHLEVRKIQKRTQAARVAIAKRGQIPNGLRCLGLRTIDRRAVIVPDEARVVRRIYRDRVAGKSCAQIARDLNAEGVPPPERTEGDNEHGWVGPNIARMVRNPRYRGEAKWGRYTLPVPAIVEPDVWFAAQPRTRGPRPKTNLVLLGFVKCGRCGYSLTTRSSRGKRPTNKHKRYYSYQCLGVRTPWVGCDLPQISKAKLEPAVDAAVRAVLTDPEQVRALRAQASAATPETTAERDELRAEDERWLEAFRAGAITTQELAAYRADVRKRLRDLDVTPERDEGDEALARMARELPLRALLEAANAVVVVQDRDDVRVSLAAM